jgi:hypothetical protein
MYLLEDSKAPSELKSSVPRFKAQAVKKTIFKPLQRTKRLFQKPKLKWALKK